MKSEDLKIEFYTGGAPNNYNSIRVTHIPTGVSATCDEFPSQLTNRAKAVERLRQKLGGPGIDDDLVPITIYMHRSELRNLAEKGDDGVRPL